MSDYINPIALLRARMHSFSSIPEQADTIAEQEFPNSARDSSVKNAFRHALGTGMMTQALGNVPSVQYASLVAGVPLQSILAKLAGYGWEGIGAAKQLWENRGTIPQDYRTDTLHDLNANAIGASTARRAVNQEDLINQLRALAIRSQVEAPPAIYAPSPGYLTRTVD